ncbi:MAG: sigma-70 family RNA polymerase sigma factor [Planctomycetaceae bacterium]|nr:sigma-70 family RNA polymerase sigma factor [Planctomycetaceae bacterium]
MTPPDNSEQTDEDLIRLINEGRMDAFETLYLRYRDWVARLAWRFTGHEEDAMDVLQETFAYLVRKFPGFQLTAAMTTFLYPAVRNLSIAANRKRRRSVSSDDLPELFASPEPSESVDSEIATLLDSLSTSHREILLMRFVDGLTQPEIAEALDVPLGTVKSRLHHAIAAVRQIPGISEWFQE